MKDDTQHLDFLISQYVDGCLDGANKKSVEQQMLTSPDARKLYSDHREVQDLLDDWGNRIPLVDWEKFDKKLATRLQHESVGGESKLKFRRWLKPLSAAAALFVAATIGYAWHALQSPPPEVVQLDPIPRVLPPHRSVDIPEGSRFARASRSSFTVEEPEARWGASRLINPAAVAVTPPGDAAAVESLIDAMGYGLKNVEQASLPPVPAPGTWAVAPTSNNDGDRAPDVAFP